MAGEITDIYWMYKSTCSTTGIVTLIEPWKEKKVAEKYEQADCETVSIISFPEGLNS